MKRRDIHRLLVAGAALPVLSAVRAAGPQGVSRGEIRIGTIQDLSGPIAMLGQPATNGLRMRFNEENARGGIHGRQLRLIVEDSGYDPKKGVLAARKLIDRDRVFAMLGTLGTPVVRATMPLVLERGLLHLFPFSPHPDTYLPTHPLKFQIFAPAVEYMRVAVRHLVARNGYRRVAVIYQDDDYGEEVLDGARRGLADAGLKPVAAISYRRGATDLSAQVSRAHDANADFLVLGTVVRETVAVVAEARMRGWPVDALVSAAGYSARVHELGGKAVEGLYAMSVLPHPYPEGADAALRDWIADYELHFRQSPDVWAVWGYTAADLFLRALAAAGPEPTPQRLATALEHIETRPDSFGSPAYRFSRSDHLGNRHARLAQIRNGRWVLASEYLK